MSEIVKKGYISVRRRNLLSSASYKQRYVVLRMSREDRGKLVEVWDSHESDREPYRLVLGSSWTVQSKTSNSGKRFAFQLLVADEVVLTFGCLSVKDREDWMKAFDIFRQMALPVPENTASVNTDEKNFFSVFLSKTHSSLEIHCGQYMLSVSNEAICLHWITTAAIAHRWARKCVQELGMRGSNLVLKVCRPGGNSSSVMEFEFRATNSTTVAILKRWNIVLMESIAASCVDPEQMDFIGKVLNKRVTEAPDGKRLTKSFRKRSQSTKEKRAGDSVKRSGSFSNSRSATLRPGMLKGGGGSGGAPPSPQQAKSGSNSPLKTPHVTAHFSSVGNMVEAVATMKPNHIQSSPPPLPPRPVLDDCSSSGEDSDYAYIKEDEVKGPARGPSHSPSQGSRGSANVGERTLDQELEDLELSIKREKEEKKRQEKRKAATIAARATHQRAPLFFTPADPEDYLEPLSALSSGGRPKSTEYETPAMAHGRPYSELDSSLCSDSKSLSQPTIHHVRGSPPRLPSAHHEHGGRSVRPSREWRTAARDGDNPDISPYAVVRQVHPGRILEETDSHASKPSHQPAHPNSLPLSSSSSAEQSPAAVATKSAVSSSATTPPSSTTTAAAGVESEGGSSAPPLPPRSPIKEKLSWGSSTSSEASNHSHRSSHAHHHAGGVRCSKCQRQKRAPVDKTMSEHRGQVPLTQTTPSPVKSSLPDLNTTVTGVPENSLQQRRPSAQRERLASTAESRSSSEGSTASLQTQANYLEIVPDSSSGGAPRPGKDAHNSNPESLQMLDDVMRCFDDKVGSLTQPDGSPEAQKLTQSLNSSPSISHQQSSPHSHMANGRRSFRRMNGVKEPPPLQRSHTSASVITHSPPHPHLHTLHHNKSTSFIHHRTPAPPVPPRSDVSLIGHPGSSRTPHHPSTNYHQPLHTTSTFSHHSRGGGGGGWARTGSSGSFGSASGDSSRSPPAFYASRTRQSSSSSIHSGSPSPTIVPMTAAQPRSWQNLARHFTNLPHEGDSSSTVFIHHLKHDRRVMHSHMV